MKIDYEVTKKIAVLGGEEGAKTKELNLVKWGSYEPSFDIRRWDCGTPKKGITLNRVEAKLLLNYLKKSWRKKEPKPFGTESANGLHRLSEQSIWIAVPATKQ